MLQQAVSDDLAEHFGKLHLSLTEIKDAASAIVFDGAETEFENFTGATQDVTDALSSMKSAFSDLNEENWKMSLGAPVTEADVQEHRPDAVQHGNIP